MTDLSEILGNVDMSAVVSLDDKLHECRFFLDLLNTEEDRDKFRWLLGAFLNACYGYLDHKATHLYYAYYDPEVDEHIPDSDGIKVLSEHVKVEPKNDNKGSIKAYSVSNFMKHLYRFRNQSTHDGGVEIMKGGKNLPQDFEIGMIEGEGVSALEFCRKALFLLEELEKQT